jgi:hypothetical protein
MVRLSNNLPDLTQPNEHSTREYFHHSGVMLAL